MHSANVAIYMLSKLLTFWQIVKDYCRPLRYTCLDKCLGHANLEWIGGSFRHNTKYLAEVKLIGKLQNKLAMTGNKAN